MAYFSADDHQALSRQQAQSLNGDLALQRAYNKLLDLHKAIHLKFRTHNICIYPYTQQANHIHFRTVAGPGDAETMSVPYFRPSAEADMVERLMGRHTGTPNTTCEARFHPVIELRLSPDYFAVELIVSPDAWWDQQNLVGKLTSKRHRSVFHNLLNDLDDEYRMGFWNGIHLSDMHLTTGQLSSPRALDEWMDTFEDGQDWFRIGYWYQPEAPALDTDLVVQEVFQRVSDLYALYSFLLWTSNNNFRNLYQRKRAYLALA